MKAFRKIFLCAICTGFLVSCASKAVEVAPENSETNAPKIGKKQRIAELNNSVFCISIVVKGTDKGKFSVGTAFLVEGNLLASAEHVSIKAGQLAQEFRNKNYEIIAWKTFQNGDYIQFPVELFVSDKNTDLALFRFDARVLKENPKYSIIKPMTLAENLPPVGEEVVSIGYYGDYEFPFNSIGNVAMIDKNEDVLSDLTIMPGNSGAPVCDLETGEVLGVTVSVLDLGNETVRFTIAKRAAKLRELLKRLEKKN